MPPISTREWMSLTKLEEVPANQLKDLPKDRVYLRELTSEEIAYTDMLGYKGQVFERKNVSITIETVPARKCRDPERRDDVVDLLTVIDSGEARKGDRS